MAKRKEPSQICIVDVSTRDVIRLTSDDSYTNRGPAWSPDGTRIAFASNRWMEGSGLGPAYEIYLMNADGSDITQLTDVLGTMSAMTVRLDWSPDGRYIVTECWDNEMCLVLCDDGTVIQLTDNEVNDNEPVWQP